MKTITLSVGDILREWRKRRALSQLDLALEADVSNRHLSFVETGRSAASRDLLMRLSTNLAMPPRARNQLLLAGGFAPIHGERSLGEPEMAQAREAVDAILEGHMPFPAVAIDGRWNLVSANPALKKLIGDVDSSLLAPPVNVLRLSLHPAGLAPRIENLAEWRDHLLARLRTQAETSGDANLMPLHAELSALSHPRGPRAVPKLHPVAVPLRLRLDSGLVLSLISTTTVFGTATDIMLAELMLECFYPADEQTRGFLLSSEWSAR